MLAAVTVTTVTAQTTQRVLEQSFAQTGAAVVPRHHSDRAQVLAEGGA